MGRLHVATLMKRMGLQAIYRRPNLSKPEPGHKIYPYLLRKLEGNPSPELSITHKSDGAGRGWTRLGFKDLRALNRL